MAKDKRSPEEILEAEIRTAKQDVLNSVDINVGPKGTADQDSKSIPKDRNTNRQAKKQLDRLDFLVEKLLRFRGELENPDGDAAADKLAYYNTIWHRQCENWNKKPRANFNLRPEAFMDRVDYFLDLEKQQVKAAEHAYKKNQFDRFVRLHHHELKWRILRCKVRALFMRKKSWRDLLIDWWDLNKKPIESRQQGCNPVPQAEGEMVIGKKYRTGPEHSPLST